MQLHVMLRTCPRPVDYLQATRNSLHAAGFEGYRLCVDLFCQRSSNGNFRTSLSRLVAESDHDDWLLTCEDDIQVATGLHAWLLTTLPTLESQFGPIGVASVYTAESVPKPNAGWNIMLASTKCLGACAIAMTREAAIDFLKVGSKAEHKTRSGESLLEWCYAVGRHWLFHSPSYVQHIGEQSAFHPFGINPDRRAGDFVASVGFSRV